MNGIPVSRSQKTENAPTWRSPSPLFGGCFLAHFWPISPSQTHVLFYFPAFYIQHTILILYASPQSHFHYPTYFISFYIEEYNKGMGNSANILTQLTSYHTNKNTRDGYYELIMDRMMESE